MRSGGVRIAAVIAGVALLGAAPADPLLLRLLAGANAVPAAALSFERTTVASQVSGGKTERHTSIERWDGRVWTLLSVDGAPATAKASAEAAKAIANGGVPGYYRLARFLAAGPVRGNDAQGRIVYRLDRLPAGTMAIKGANPEKFAAELVVDTSGPVPYVRHARYYAPAPMRIMMVARLDRFEAGAEFRLAPSGRAELVRQTVDVAGALFGRDGSQHSEATFAYR